MEVLSHHMQRLLFKWQQSPWGSRWAAAMIAITMIMIGLVSHAYFKQQQLETALQQLPVSHRLAQQSEKTQPSASSISLEEWPAEEAADGISAEILSLADAMGMIFERAEFQSVPVEHSVLQIQRIKLPLKGDYLQIRHFLSEVLQRYPTLALSQFKLQRSDVLQSDIEAYVEFSLYTRKKAQT